MGNKCCKSIKEKYLSTQENTTSEKYETSENDDEIIIPTQQMNSLKKSSLKSISFDDSGLSHSFTEIDNNESIEDLKTITEKLNSQKRSCKNINIQVNLALKIY